MLCRPHSSGALGRRVGLSRLLSHLRSHLRSHLLSHLPSYRGLRWPSRWLSRLSAAGVCALATLLAVPTQAAISMLDDAELFLVIWDPVGESSYVRDLGVSVNSFFTQAQADAGYQSFFPRLTVAGDPRFQKLLNGVAPAAQQHNLAAVPFSAESPFGFAASNLKDRLRWAVLAVDSDGFDYPDLRLFHTLEQGPGDGRLNPSYGALSTLNNANLSVSITPMATTLVIALNGGAPDGGDDNTHVRDGLSTNYAANGSSITLKGMSGYFDAPQTEFYRLSTAAGVPVTNAVGRSSWFYFTLPSSTDDTERVLIDEFDNLTADGYWGLDQDPIDGAFVLSFTIEGNATAAALRLREFAAGIGRTEAGGGWRVRRLHGVAALGLETGAGFSRRSLDGAAAAPSLSLTLPTSPVPEPRTWALWLAGLAALGAWARQRRRA